MKWFTHSFVGQETGKWYLDLKSGSGSCGKGDAPATPDVTFVMKDNDFHKMFSGKSFLCAIGGNFHLNACSLPFQENWSLPLPSWQASSNSKETWARPWSWKSWWEKCKQELSIPCPITSVVNYDCCFYSCKNKVDLALLNSTIFLKRFDTRMARWVELLFNVGDICIVSIIVCIMSGHWQNLTKATF